MRVCRRVVPEVHRAGMTTRKASRPLASPLLTTEDLATYLAVPVATIYRWRTLEEGPPAFRVGRGLRYRLADVDRWLTQRAA